jgi:hypothetical protein
MSAQLIHDAGQTTMTHPTTSAGLGRLGSAWRQFRLAVAEMNYAARRVVEIQAPWTVDDQWHTK